MFDECGCVTTCRMLKMSQLCEGCKPICRCPEDSYDLDGTCVDKYECLAVDTEMDNKEKIKRKCKFIYLNQINFQSSWLLRIFKISSYLKLFFSLR